MGYKYNPFSGELDRVDAGGSGADPIETLTGNSGGAVSPDGAYNVNILGDNTQGIDIVGNPATNTLTASGIDATVTQIGVSELATDAETIAGTDSTRVIVSTALKAKLGVQTLNSIPFGQGDTLALGWTSALTNGQIIIGGTGFAPLPGSLTSTGGTIVVTGGPNTINLETGATVATSYTCDTGSAVPALGVLTVIGQDGITTSGATSIVTITPRGVGTANMFLGQGAGNLTLSGASNVGYGLSTLVALTSGARNVAIGPNSGQAIATGVDNVSVGFEALKTNIAGGAATAVGSGALALSTATDNTAVGAAALAVNVTGINNTGIGRSALAAATGNSNTAVGHTAGAAITSGIQNTCMGSVSLLVNTTSSNNTAFGYGTLGANTGASNVAIGFNALAANISGSPNTAVGNEALLANLGGSSNTGIGNRALFTNSAGAGNTAVGNAALLFNVNGSNNVAVGVSALQANLTSNNTAVGHSAGSAISTGTQNAAVGTSSLASLTTANNNTAMGYQTLFSSTGDGNTAFGRAALNVTGAGTNNTALGLNAGFNISTGGSNVALGASCLGSLGTGSNNIAIGASAGSALTLADNNNIIIESAGVVGDVTTIRIGTFATHTKSFMAGVAGVTAANAVHVTIDSTTGQLGVGPSSSLGWVDEGSGITLVENTNYFVTAAVTETMPASPAQGDTIKIICDHAGPVVITANTGQTISLGATSSSTAGTFTSTSLGDSLELIYRNSSTEWKALNSVGNWTIA